MKSKSAFILIELPARKPRLWRRQTKSAFTLIEMLVVIAIIALLVSIMFPVVGSMLERARLTQCGQRLGQLQRAMMLYANDHNGRLPNPSGDGNDKRFGYYLNPYLEGFEKNHYGVPERYRCPNARFYNLNVHTQGMNYYYSGLYVRRGNLARTVMLSDTKSSFYLFKNRWTAYFHARHNDPTRQGVGKLSLMFGDGHWETMTWDTWMNEHYSKPHEKCAILNPGK